MGIAIGGTCFAGHRFIKKSFPIDTLYNQVDTYLHEITFPYKLGEHWCEETRSYKCDNMTGMKQF